MKFFLLNGCSVVIKSLSLCPSAGDKFIAKQQDKKKKKKLKRVEDKILGWGKV